MVDEDGKDRAIDCRLQISTRHGAGQEKVICGPSEAFFLGDDGDHLAEIWIVATLGMRETAGMFGSLVPLCAIAEASSD
ncbi:hypothetical protein H6P81_009754 [Aristolochia fimbriata]|uniref:Uncharacterized protein n=1 Tax=Aristolochia fimbriata TaxID=158543 RepID=A0AAV7EMQ3_ARIFI|nr:hypothetical protein H6P81_009754 [Aristolochia fimbriata]